jgi:hypothetical protein
LSKLPDGRHLFDFAIIAAPLFIFSAIMFWFSQYRIIPDPTVEASVANPVGLFTSNFVYDGSINIENILSSSVFLLVVCLYYPRPLRVFLVYFLPFAAVVAGGLAELTAISSPYVSLPFCSKSCSFYGMSGIASAMIGFTFAGFAISFALIIVRRAGGFNRRDFLLPEGSRRRSIVVLISSFVLYLLLLLFFSGVIALPRGSSTAPGGGSSSGPPPPPAIFTQPPPVALVHSASLVYGFVLCITTFILVNRRYHLFSPPVHGDLG